MIVALLLSLAAQDWRTWRGPTGNGIAAEGERPPLTWSETENVLWKTPVPGRGHSSPTVVGKLVVLTTADDAAQVQSVLAFDRGTGKPLWTTEIHRGSFPAMIHEKNSHASCTVASDGERLYASFYNNEAVHVTALDLEGRKVWQTNAGPLRPKQYKHGYAPSPALHGGMVLIAVDTDDPGYLVALEAKTGRERWRTPRPVQTSYSSPVVARVAGRDQLLLSGCETVSSYDPAGGKALWSAPGTTAATCGTIVWDGDLVFASGGYPKSETLAVRADGSGTVVWKNSQKCYEQSMLAWQGHLYAVNDVGVAFCWAAADGTARWTARLTSKPSASPVLVDGNIHISDEKGTTTVFRADPKEYKQVAQNRLGDHALATPSYCGNRIYARVAKLSGGRRDEFLYCIGKP